MRLPWDALLHALLERVRLVFMPLVNPGGMLRGTRANPNGVDLMRNAPVDALEPRALPGGRPAHQRRAALVPRRRRVPPCKAESAALCRVVEERTAGRGRSAWRWTATRASGCATGSGFRSRTAARPIEHLPEMHALHEIFEQTQQPPSLCVRAAEPPVPGAWRPVGPPLPPGLRAAPERVFLPLTLEMGSWLWVKKNPRQLFSRHGHLQSADRPSPAAGASPAFAVARLRRAGCRRRQPLAAADAACERHRQQAMGRWYSMTTWVLLRGLTREAGHWGDFAPAAGRPSGPHR